MDLRQGIYTALLEAFVRLFASLSKEQPSLDEFKRKFYGSICEKEDTPCDIIIILLY